VLEERRAALEAYVQHFAKSAAQALLRFLEVPQPSHSSHAANGEAAPFSSSRHQPVSGFGRDPFLVEDVEEDDTYHGRYLPDIVSEATIDYFYRRPQ